MIPFRVAAALLYVADDAAEDPLVSVGFHIDFDVQEAADPLVGEKQDALNEDDRSRLDLDDLAGSVVLAVVVDGHSMVFPAFSSFRCSTKRSVSRESGWS